jgi:phosphinothricin acetyltransferase
MTIVPCTYADHAEAILALFNDAILNSTALFIYEPRTLDFMKEWFANKKQSHTPILGAIDDQGELLGFASYGPFRPQAAYKYTIENSIYVAKPYYGKGVGSQLLQALIAKAEEQQYHVMIGAIDATNTASIALHRKFGFEAIGTIKDSAFKFGRWLDMTLFQLTLNSPENPCDG